MGKKFTGSPIQFLYGNPVEVYELPPYAMALLDSLLEDIKRVYRNVHQALWKRYENPGIPRIDIRSYYWGEDEDLARLPNFVFEDVRIKWYKYPGRGTSCNVDWCPSQWVGWFNRCLRVIDLYEEANIYLPPGSPLIEEEEERSDGCSSCCHEKAKKEAEKAG